MTPFYVATFAGRAVTNAARRGRPRCSRPDRGCGWPRRRQIVAQGAWNNSDIRVIAGGEALIRERKSAQVCRKELYDCSAGGRVTSPASVAAASCAGNLLRRIPDKQRHAAGGRSRPPQRKAVGVKWSSASRIVHGLHRTGGTAQVQRARRVITAWMTALLSGPPGSCTLPIPDRFGQKPTPAIADRVSRRRPCRWPPTTIRHDQVGE